MGKGGENKKREIGRQVQMRSRGGEKRKGEWREGREEERGEDTPEGNKERRGEVKKMK